MFDRVLNMPFNWFPNICLSVWQNQMFECQIWISKVADNLLLKNKKQNKANCKIVERIHSFSNLTLRSQRFANINETFQNIYHANLLFILRSGVGSSFRTPYTGLVFHTSPGIITHIWWKISNSYMVRGWSAFI